MYFTSKTWILINKIHISLCVQLSMPVPVAAPFNTSVCGRSLAGIAASNPAGVLDVCLL